MSQHDSKPDLEESINVSEAHGRLARDIAASAREKRIVEGGGEPISAWVLAACGVAVLVAGGILGGAGELFSYNTTYRPGYERTPPPGVVDTGPQPKEALAAYMAKGAKIYSAKCNGCHGPDAKGDGANFPSLAGSAWITGDTQRLAMIILNGMQGPTSTGKTYGVMPPQGVGLSAADLAGIMTYVRNHFGNSTGDVVTIEMAKAALEISSARGNVGQMTSATELDADHAKALPGEPLDPKALLDPVSLAPATAPAP